MSTSGKLPSSYNDIGLRLVVYNVFMHVVLTIKPIENHCSSLKFHEHMRWVNIECKFTYFLELVCMHVLFMYVKKRPG
jgi:hypothetical protein